jgi:lipid-A-disaccharide synthase
MRYFIIAGEASGDLHASNLMASLKKEDSSAEFCFLGGDLMLEQGGKMVRHYRDMAFMGFIPVLLHARTILKNMKDCKQALLDFNPDVLILVDYPSFNLKIAKFAKKNLKNLPVFYYISPKLWAWKEYRLKSIKKYVDKVYSILPFEVEWYKDRGYEIEYVGNPCVDAVSSFVPKYEDRGAFLKHLNVSDRPILAILAGSRMQEIESNLPVVLKAVSTFQDHQIVLAGAPSIEMSVYDSYLKDFPSVKVVTGETYELLKHSDVAVVTSGTATLETALLRVPQVVVYKMNGGKLLHKLKDLFLNVKFISLVNLITNRELVVELVIEEVTEVRVRREVARLLEDDYRLQVLEGYDRLIETLGKEPVSDKAARLMFARLNGQMA